MSAARAIDAPNLQALLDNFKQELEAAASRQPLADEEADALYSEAYAEYTNGQFDHALSFFVVLVLHRPAHTVYLLGAALCLQRLQRYSLAIAAYGALAFLEPQQPRHTLALAECQLLCGQHAQAHESLCIVADLCAKQPGHELVGARAAAMLQLMRPRDEVAAAA